MHLLRFWIASVATKECKMSFVEGSLAGTNSKKSSHKTPPHSTYLWLHVVFNCSNFITTNTAQACTFLLHKAENIRGGGA